MWVIIAVLVGVVAWVIISNAINAGVQEITFDQMTEYIDNSSLYFDEDTNSVASRYDVIKDVSKYSYDRNTQKYYVNENGKTSEVIVVKRLEVSQYNMNGYVQGANGLVRRFVSVGPSLYSSDVLDSEKLESWMALGLEISYDDPNSGSYLSSILNFLLVAVMVIVFVLLIRSTMTAGGKAMSFGKSKARVSTNLKVRFSDVAGADEEKVELAEIVEFLKQPQKFSNLGARIPKGVLLVGPPGTGKTLFAKAVAGESGVPFFSVSGSDFVELYVGMGASRVRDLFEMAKKNAPCIVFIDEIDAVGRQRGAGLGGGNDEREQTLNQILVQMDGFESNEGVIVMAATNRSDILDPALTRPGRFDRQVFVNLPDVKGREMILKVHARNKPLASDVNFKTIARVTAGFSGADLENLLNEAAILAARENKQFIDNDDLYEGFTKVAMGPKKKSRVVTERDKRITAYHEAGHAVLARLCENHEPVQEVTIIPRGNAGGYTLYIPDNDDNYRTVNQLNDAICSALGGRVAEELVIKDVSTGASGDLEHVTQLAKRMVTEWGMSDKLGLVTYGSNSQTVFLGRDMETHNAYSEVTASAIDSEMRSIIETAHERAVKLLSENRSILDNMARVLIERETIYAEEIDMLMAGKTHAEVIEYMDKKAGNGEHKGSNNFKRFE